MDRGSTSHCTTGQEDHRYQAPASRSPPLSADGPDHRTDPRTHRRPINLCPARRDQEAITDLMSAGLLHVGGGVVQPTRRPLSSTNWPNSDGRQTGRPSRRRAVRSQPLHGPPPRWLLAGRSRGALLVAPHRDRPSGEGPQAPSGRHAPEAHRRLGDRTGGPLKGMDWVLGSGRGGGFAVKP